MTATRTDRITTPWDTGRFDGRSGPPRLLFGRTFEDPAIELGLFAPGGTVLCIASAGDTARALAAARHDVIAVDINPAQIDEVRRRLEGRAPRAGAADRLLALGRGALRPLGWRRARLDRFCQLDDPRTQAIEWARLTSPLVRVAVRAAVSPGVLRLAYGESFARLVPPRFGDALVDRVGRHVAISSNRDNPWLALLLTGVWSTPDPVDGADRIELRDGDVAQILEALPANSLDGISVSNVLDGPGSAYADRLLAAARRAGRPDAPIIVRSFLEPSDPSAVRLASRDRSLLWGGITVHRA